MQMTKIANVVLRGHVARGAKLVRLSKATDVDPGAVSRSEVVVWVPATVASGPAHGPKSIRDYGKYAINVSFDSFVPFDTQNRDGVQRASLACVLFHTQGVQLVEYELPAVTDAVMEYCEQRGKLTSDRMTFAVRRTRGQKEFKLLIGDRVVLPSRMSGWLKVDALMA